MLAAVRLTPKRVITVLTMVGMMWWGWAPAPTTAAEVVAGTIQSDYSETSSFGPQAEAQRHLAEERLSWTAPGRSDHSVQVKILAINDFHGQIGIGKKGSGRPVGSAPVLAAYLEKAQQEWEGTICILEKMAILSE